MTQQQKKQNTAPLVWSFAPLEIKRRVTLTLQHYYRSLISAPPEGPSINDISKFSRFLTLPPSVSSFLLLSVGKFGKLLTPPPPKKCRRYKWMVPFKGLSDFRTWILSILQELNFCSEWHQNGKFKFLFNSTERLKIWETIIIDQLYTIFSLFHFAFNNIKKMIAVLSIA